jgi:PKD repeat protein
MRTASSSDWAIPPRMETFESRELLSVAIDLEVSRVLGVAPLAVHFDASGTTSTATTRPFHELDYAWEFGDDGAGQWDLSGAEKNEAFGAIAAHVYDQVGTYDVTLTVTDAEGSVDTRQVSVEVQDPDVIFAGTDTICFSTSGDFTGAPDGAQHVTTTSFGTIAGYAAAGKRLLLARGETWTNSAGQRINNPGPGIFGAFGTGDKPQIVTSSGLFYLSDRRPDMADWRFMDLDLSGAAGTSGFSFSGTGDDVLIYRVDMKDFGTGIGSGASVLNYWNDNGYPGHTLHDGLAIVETTIDHAQGGGGNNGMYLCGQRLMILGTSITDCDEVEHTVRTPWLEKAVLSNSYFGVSASAKHQLKLHAPGWDSAGLGYHHYSEQIIVSDNTFQGGANPWSVTPGPQNSGSDERVRDLIFERNLFRSGSGTQVSLVNWARDVTIRNNVFDLDAGDRAISIGVRGVEPPSADVSVLNNTFYSTGSSTAVGIASVASNTTVRNNLLTPSGTMITGTGSGLIADHNLTTASPRFVSTTPFERADFALQDDSPAVDFGTPVPVFRDLFRAERPQGDAYDVGASELQPASLPGDANGDGTVSDADYTIWADHYGQGSATFDMGDFNGDGDVTDADYTIWADNYGQSAAASAAPAAETQSASPTAAAWMQGVMGPLPSDASLTDPLAQPWDAQDPVDLLKILSIPQS